MFSGAAYGNTSKHMTEKRLRLSITLLLLCKKPISSWFYMYIVYIELINILKRLILLDDDSSIVLGVRHIHRRFVFHHRHIHIVPFLG
jgi:hypothetical protein